MASEQQLALARSHRMPQQSSHISKAARQVVPAFLQKLYEMVNDPNNQELIRWSDAGDSFFGKSLSPPCPSMLDHERFAHEVLGRWFKHKNFNSFVRQLNMYGFHKIPHLQQGVLKSDTDTDFWNFAHTNFHRGQPDLLCLIQRKKQMPQGANDSALDLRDPNAPHGAPNASAANPSAGNPVTNASGQVLDVQSIIAGLNAIKRHQTAISSELNELKRSNQLLWQDALQSRSKFQKQQDTINRIVKFLAGVFGNSAGSPSPGSGKTSVGSSPLGKDSTDAPIGPLSRRKALLMIEDAKRDGPAKAAVEELSEIPLEIDTSYPSRTSPFPALAHSSSNLSDSFFNGTHWGCADYPSIENPTSAASPAPSVTLSDHITVADTPTTTTSYFPSTASDTTSRSNNTSTHPASNSNPTPSITIQHPSPQNLGTELSRAVTPTNRPPSAPAFELDPRVSSFLNTLPPGQLSALLQSLASQTMSDSSLAPNSSSNVAMDTSTSTSSTSTSTDPSSAVSNSYHQTALMTPYHSTPYDLFTDYSSSSFQPTPLPGGSTGVGVQSNQFNFGNYDLGTTPIPHESGANSSTTGSSSSPSNNNDDTPTLGHLPNYIFAPDSLISPFSYDPSSTNDQHHLSSLSPSDLAHADRLAAEWRAVEDVNKDVDAVDSHIHNFIQGLGLDPSLLISMDPAPSSSSSSSLDGPGTGAGMSPLVGNNATLRASPAPTIGSTTSNQTASPVIGTNKIPTTTLGGVPTTTSTPSEMELEAFFHNITAGANAGAGAGAGGAGASSVQANGTGPGAGAGVGVGVGGGEDVMMLLDQDEDEDDDSDACEVCDGDGDDHGHGGGGRAARPAPSSTSSATPASTNPGHRKGVSVSSVGSTSDMAGSALGLTMGPTTGRKRKSDVVMDLDYDPLAGAAEATAIPPPATTTASKAKPKRRRA